MPQPERRALPLARAPAGMRLAGMEHEERGPFRKLHGEGVHRRHVAAGHRTGPRSGFRHDRPTLPVGEPRHRRVQPGRLEVDGAVPDPRSVPLENAGSVISAGEAFVVACVVHGLRAHHTPPPVSRCNSAAGVSRWPCEVQHRHDTDRLRSQHHFSEKPLVGVRFRCNRACRPARYDHGCGIGVSVPANGPIGGPARRDRSAGGPDVGAAAAARVAYGQGTGGGSPGGPTGRQSSALRRPQRIDRWTSVEWQPARGHSGAGRDGVWRSHERPTHQNPSSRSSPRSAWRPLGPCPRMTWRRTARPLPGRRPS